MADRYLVGTGNRNITDGSIWSSTSGSAGADLLGSDTLVNGDFSSGSTGWIVSSADATHIVTFAGSTLRFQSDTLSPILVVTQNSAMVVGKCYKLTVVVSAFTGTGNIKSDQFNGLPITGGTTGTFTYYAVAYQANFSFYRSGTNVDITIDSFKIEEVLTYPTLSDNVFFDANSGTGILTVNANFACANLSIQSISAITISGSVYTFSVYGSLLLPATNLTITFTGTAYWYMKATTSVNITMGATTGRSFNRLYFDGVGGTWTNQDEMNVENTSIYLTNGTWNINGYTFTTLGAFTTSTGTKALTLGSGTFKIPIWNNVTPTGFSFNSGTGTVEINVNLTRTLTSADTFYNLTFLGTGALISISLTANIVVLNTLAITGNNSTNYRLLVASNTIGTPRTITCNGTITASNVDFRDITLAGSASGNLSAITGGSGDCGGNSGITFTAAVPQYYKHTSGACTWKDATKWFTDLTPRTTAGRVPLPQDDPLFDAASFTGTSTLTVDCPRIGRSLDMSGVDDAVTFTLANAIECYGSYVLGSNVTPSGNFTKTMMGRSTFNINLYGKTIYDLVINALGGTYTYLSSFIFRRFTQTNGTIVMGAFIHESNETSAATVWSYTAGIVTPETSTIKINPASGANNLTLTLGSKTYNKVQFSGSHTGNFDITGSNTIAELIVDPGRKVRFTAGTTQQIAKATIGTGATITSPTAATHTLNYTGSDRITTDSLTVSYSNATPANKWYAGNSSVDGGNNTGWIYAHYQALIAGVINTLSDINNILSGRGKLEVVTNANSDVTNTLTGSGKLQGVVDTLSSVINNLLQSNKIQGIINTESSTSSVLFGTGSLLGQVSTISEIINTLSGKGLLLGEINTLTQTLSLLLGKKYCESLVITKSFVTGSLTGRTSLEGSVTCNSSTLGRLRGVGKIINTVDGNSITTTTLTAKGYLIGQINTGSSVVVNLNTVATGRMFGVIQTGSSVSANFRGSGNLQSIVNSNSNISGRLNRNKTRNAVLVT